jgi:hypothetical protein
MEIGDINIYYQHERLTPGQVRVAIYGRDRDSWVFIPGEGDVINGFPGYMGDPITVRVVKVERIGEAVEAYQVTVADVAE